jgi:hypothetical protein
MLRGETLDDIVAAWGGITRERVRHLQTIAEVQFSEAISGKKSLILKRFDDVAGDQLAVLKSEMWPFVRASDPTALQFAFRQVGLSDVKIGACHFLDWCTRQPDVLEERFNQFRSMAPIPADQYDARARALGIGRIATMVSYDADWIWSYLTEKFSRNIPELMRRRQLGETLADIGVELDGITRERVRQLQDIAKAYLADAVRESESLILRRFDDLAGDQLAILKSEMWPFIRASDPVAFYFTFREVGLSDVKIGTCHLPDWCTRQPGAVRERFKLLLSMAPIPADELDARARVLGIGQVAEIALRSGDTNLKFLEGLGWVRRGRITRDSAYLFLKREAEPRNVPEIATRISANEHATRENMRRDVEFVQVRPDGTWALTEWRLPGLGRSYSSATEVVVELLSERGPLSFQQLIREAQRLYPVTTWRYTQTLSDSRIGRNAEGLYDLVERGATPIEDPEPSRPASMFATDDGRIVGVKLTVDREVLRGSGISVSRWLTWKVGLSATPSSRTFDLLEPIGEISVRKNTSSSAISSLRSFVAELELGEGCEIILLLNTEAGTAKLKHACGPASCKVLVLNDRSRQEH